MNDPGQPLSGARPGLVRLRADAPYVAYTQFAQAEELLERYLGDGARVVVPAEHRDGFVRVLPWVNLVFLPFHALAVLAVVGFSALSSVIGGPSLFGGLMAVAMLALRVMALPGLLERKRQGWALLVYAIVLGAISSLLRLAVNGLLLDLALLWLVFQVKYRYE